MRTKQAIHYENAYENYYSKYEESRKQYLSNAEQDSGISLRPQYTPKPPTVWGDIFWIGIVPLAAFFTIVFGGAWLLGKALG